MGEQGQDERRLRWLPPGRLVHRALDDHLRSSFPVYSGIKKIEEEEEEWKEVQL